MMEIRIPDTTQGNSASPRKEAGVKMMEFHATTSRSIGFLFIAMLVLFVLLVVWSWFLTIQLSRSRAYDLGRRDEAMQNPARVYIEDGTPFVWHKGTYSKARMVKARTFVAE